MDKTKREIFCYLLIFIVLVIIVMLNNFYWKLGKEKHKTDDNIVYLESNNVIYNVPYDDMELD